MIAPYMGSVGAGGLGRLPIGEAARLPTTAAAATVGFTLDAALHVAPGCPEELRRALARTFVLANSLYTEAIKHDRDTRGLAEYLCYYSSTDDGALIVPRGATEIVAHLCAAQGVRPVCEDHTYAADPVDFDERIALSAAQERAVGEVLRRRMGVLQAPAGSGKTIMAMALIARRRQPALIIVHTKELAAQAIARAVAVLGLDEAEIGLVGDGECRIGARLTVALVQTLARGIPPALLRVGHVVVDEAHHCPAAQMAAVVSQFPARYLLGLSATPYRRDKLDQVIFWHLGPIAARIDAADLADRLVTPRIIKRDTGLRVAGDSFAEIVSQLVADDARNRLILADVARAVAAGRRCLVLSDRVGHVERLAWLLTAAGVRAAPLHGQLPRWERAGVVEDLVAGNLAVVVATGSLVGEGFDCPALDALFIATPVSYGGRVVQYLGRVSRTAPGKVDAVVYDYCDDCAMLWATWRNRRRVYARQGCAVLMSGQATAIQRRAS